MKPQEEISLLLERHHFHFSKSMGQNFLFDQNVLQEIAEASSINNTCGVLEVGPGIGALSSQLCCRAKQVVAIEIDNSLLPILSETMAEFSNFTVIQKDALKVDFAKIVMQYFQGLHPVVCANLPYQITTPLLTALLSCRQWERITVLVQKEVAERICATCGNRTYGAFSAIVQYYAKPSILFDVDKESFYPVPKVTSSLLCLEPHAQNPVSVQSEDFLFRTIYASFALRRKTLVNSLHSIFGSQLSKEKIQDLVCEVGFDPMIRGERLSLQDFAQLSDALYQRVYEQK